jgi:F-type H+-transporting ATPase subunit b
MQDAPTTSGTAAPTQGGGAGFPPFRVETFPSQLFWLAITFSFLFVVLWRVAGPRISGVIAARKKHVADDLGAAEKHRREAEEASSAYQAALTAARSRAQSVAEENRKRITTGVERAKAEADSEAQKAVSTAEARIFALRVEAKNNVIAAAQDAAIEIVSRLTGVTITPEEAAAAIRISGR